MHLKILLSLTLFVLVIQANCSKSDENVNLDNVVKEAADIVSQDIERNPNASRPLTEKSLVIPYANSKYGVELQLSNGKADGLSSFEGENGNNQSFGNNAYMLLYFKFDNLSFSFNYETDNTGKLHPSGNLQFVANDIQFNCSVKVKSAYEPLVLGEFFISKDTRVGKMELLFNNRSYKDYAFHKEFDFEVVLKEYAQKMGDYARETLSEYSNILKLEIEDLINLQS